MDYEKLKQSAIERRAKLVRREKEIEIEISDLTLEAENVRRELAGVDQIIDGLVLMESEAMPEPPGMTEQIKRALQLTTVPLSPVQLRDSLKAVGITGSSDKHLLISVHTILTRLKPNLVEVQQDGKTVYKWKDIGRRIIESTRKK